MKIDMARFRATFFEEAREHLERMEASLMQLEDAPEDDELLNTIFRAAHSIKGASATFGIEQVGNFTHVLENLLDRLRAGEIRPAPELIELLLRATDVLAGLIAAERDQTHPPDDVRDVYAALVASNQSSNSPPSTHDGAAGPAAAACAKWRVNIQPSADFFRYGQDPLLILGELRRLGDVTACRLDDTRVPPFDQMDPESCYLAWSLVLESQQPRSAIEDVFMFFDDQSVAIVEPYDEPSVAMIAEQATSVPLTAPAGGEAGSDESQSEKRKRDRTDGTAVAAGGKESVRVDRDRLDKLINQIGELVIGTSMVEQEWTQCIPGSESPALGQLGKIVRDLQEMSLSLRMIPVAGIFQKTARVVRDLSRKLGKSVRFDTEGDETELDKTVVDQIGDPLLHMVRNSVDHGIECVEERLRAGKPAEGRIALKAYHQGGNFIIEVVDDGRGLDRDAILARAIERGIVDPDNNLPDDEIYGLIFEPGFSTAQTVSDISGRGVGMDVVRRNVETLQGSITVRSVYGQGCRITIRLPLTLAILDGLLVRARNDVYVIPLLSVVESIHPAKGDVKQMLGLGEVVSLRGEVVPLLNLQRLFSHPDNGDSDSSQELLVIVEDQGKKFAVVVDELLGQQQVVIKNLETNFVKVQGVAGATILGDGRVALILDIGGLTLLPRRSRAGLAQTTSA